MQAKAKVRVELLIDIDSTWGDDCTVGQIHKHAKDGANLILSKAFDRSMQKIKMITNLEVSQIIFNKD